MDYVAESSSSSDFLELQKFCVLGPVSRAGSTLLLDLLAQHPDIECLPSEPFQKEEIDTFYTKSHQNGLSYIASRMLSSPTKICGFKLLSHQPPTDYRSMLNVDFARLVDFLVETRFKILLIERRDILAWLASHFLAEMEGAYHGREYSSKKQVIPEDYVLRTLSYLRHGRKITSRLLRGLASKYSVDIDTFVQPLIYEELVADRNQTMKNAQLFLDIPNPVILSPPAKTIKQAVKPLDEYISNLPQIRELIDNCSSKSVSARLDV